MSDRRIPFTPADEDRIASASLWGIIAAVTCILSALVKAGYGLMHYLQLPALARKAGAIQLGGVVEQCVFAVIWLLVGIWLIQACVAFRKVARTDVADKAYLLRGFDKLYAYFGTIGALMVLAFVAGAIRFIFVVARGSAALGH